MEIVLHDGRKQIMIRGGERDFELCEQKKQGEVMTWAAVSWYSDLANALTAVAKRKIRNSEARTLQELKEVIQSVRQELMAVWQIDKAA